LVPISTLAAERVFASQHLDGVSLVPIVGHGA
jgi:hypothetical protein